jgi:hypothetical protein
MLRTQALRLAAVAGLAFAVASVTPALAQPNPGGNNGFIKVDDQPLDSIPNNKPHVGCVFRIDFYNYDLNNSNATIQFTGIPPTGGGPLANGVVFIGGDAAGGGNDLDGSATFDLSAALANITPHPQQGHHVRVVVNAPGSNGPDNKSKVFWVEGCGGPPPTTTTSTTTSTTQPTTTTTMPTTTTTKPTTTTTAPSTTTTAPKTTTTAPPSTTTAPPTTAAPHRSTTTAPAVIVPSTSPPKPTAPPTTSPGSNLARTGSETGPYVAIGLGLLVGGAVLALAAHKRLRNAS